MGDRATVRVVEPAYHIVLSDGLHALLHGERLGSGPTYGYRKWQPSGMSLHRGKQPSSTGGCDRPTRRGTGRGIVALRQVPASPATLP
jgi:hypothetical protein